MGNKKHEKSSDIGSADNERVSPAFQEIALKSIELRGVSLELTPGELMARDDRSFRENKRGDEEGNLPQTQIVFGMI